MNLALLAEMAADGGGDRVAVGPGPDGLTYRELWGGSRRAASVLAAGAPARVAFVGPSWRT